MSARNGFRALRVRDPDGVTRAAIETVPRQLPADGEVLIRAEWSGVSYKDALAVTGRGKILRRLPMTAGIDVAGTIAASRDPRFREGDAVLVTGCGLGEQRDGGFAELVSVPADWPVSLPAGMTARQAMALGTAGFTVALALERMERNGQSPELGPVLVTGATGGVGSIAVDVFAGRGYPVVAVTRKASAGDYLRRLGAASVVEPASLASPGAGPLASARWGGAVDSVGGALLAEILRAVRPGGSVAAIGLAGGHTLATTVMPFILRGVSLLGIDSSGCPLPLRRRLWERLASDLAPRHLAAIVAAEVGLEDVPGVAARMLAGETVGRTLVRIRADP